MIKKLLTLLVIAVVALTGCRSAEPTASDVSSAPSAAPTGVASGCPTTATPPDDLIGAAMITGNRANTRLAAPELVACYLNPLVNRPAHVIAVSADGRPQATFDERIADRPAGRKLSEERQTFARRLLAALSVPAEDAEVDLLEAIAIAARGLRADRGPRRIMINDSLLQTTGALPLQRGYLFTDTEDLITELEPHLRRTLGDLRGFEIVLLAPGATADPQPPMTAENRTRLVELWRVILVSRGATVAVDPGTMTVDPPAGARPKVTVVPMRPPAPPASPRACREVLGSDRVQFVSDSARFLDPVEAQATITAAARKLRDCRGKLTLIGTTSSAGTAAGRRLVSTRRAKAVRAVLARELGVSPTSITVKGVGMDFPGFVPDRRADGSLDSVRAQRNRTVIIDVRR